MQCCTDDVIVIGDSFEFDKQFDASAKPSSSEVGVSNVTQVVIEASDPFFQDSANNSKEKHAWFPDDVIVIAFEPTVSQFQRTPLDEKAGVSPDADCGSAISDGRVNSLANTNVTSQRR